MANPSMAMVVGVDRGDAGVVDFEPFGAGQGDAKEEGKERPDDAAMREDGDPLVGMCGEDMVEDGAHAETEISSGFAVGESSAIHLAQPVEGADAKLFVNFSPTESGPFPKIDFAKVGNGHGCRGIWRCAQVRRQGELHPLHRAGVNGVEPDFFQPLSGETGLFVSAIREADIETPAEHSVELSLNLGVADQEKLGHSGSIARR